MFNTWVAQILTEYSFSCSGLASIANVMKKLCSIG